MKKFGIGLLIIIFLFGGGFAIRAFSTYKENKEDFAIQKIDDATKYESLQNVENTARAMISSYESDKLVYEQYKDSEKDDEQSWGQQAKMRANKTASIYNNYILKNEFKWKGNVPEDIGMELLVIE